MSCTKNIDQHKSCYGFQDVGNEGHVFKARKHQDNDDLGLAVGKHLSTKTLIGPGKLPGLSSRAPGLISRGSLRYSWINRREGRHRNTKCRSRSMSLLLLRDLILLTQCSVLVLFRFSPERSPFLSIRCGPFTRQKRRNGSVRNKYRFQTKSPVYTYKFCNVPNRKRHGT